MKIIEFFKKTMNFKVQLSLLLVCVIGLGCQFGSSPAEEEKATFSLRFYPSTIDLNENGDITTIKVMVDQASRLIAVKLTVSFDPSIVEVTRVDTSGDGFIFTDAGAQAQEIENIIDNENGRVVVGIGGLLSGFTGASGSGSLAALWFKSKAVGESSINFVDANKDDLIASVYSSSASTGWTELPIQIFNGNIVVKKAE
ncbi:MAG: hypothetical protein HOC71_17725 [Candidatus Latescibacteria bacterium]|nr:hypothetical protein [Candidatus Latescibacterota bacterium]